MVIPHTKTGGGLFVCLFVVCLFGWLVGWLVGLVGWLVGWLVGFLWEGRGGCGRGGGGLWEGMVGEGGGGHDDARNRDHRDPGMISVLNRCLPGMTMLGTETNVFRV